MKFGKLTAIKMVGRTKHYQVLWLCRCDCGNEIVVTGTNLRSGASKSCGCYRIKHGLTGSKIYAAYKHMKDRCLNPLSQSYKDYGGRGISVCEEWLGKDGFEKFEKWSSSHGYKEGLSLDRIDNDKGYCLYLPRIHGKSETTHEYLQFLKYLMLQYMCFQ